MPGLPLVASEHGGTVDLTILLIHVAMVVAFVVWTSFFLVALVRFRRGNNPQADYEGLKSKMPYVLIGVMTVAEIAILLGISLPFWDRHVVEGVEHVENPLVVRVVAQQFQWNFHYPGDDGVFGRTLPSLIDEVENPVGLDHDDPAGEDDVVKRNVLRIPVGRDIVAHITSKDVIHGFNLPEFRVKQDAVPGRRVPVTFTASMTTEQLRETVGDERRQFEIACAQLCGLGHYRMRGFVRVITDEEYAAWYKDELELKQEYENW